ncbi:hypothetical protein RCL1_004343 [Eukaryota sp. TZLM3-RCL]
MEPLPPSLFEVLNSFITLSPKKLKSILHASSVDESIQFCDLLTASLSHSLPSYIEHDFSFVNALDLVFQIIVLLLESKRFHTRSIEDLLIKSFSFLSISSGWNEALAVSAGISYLNSDMQRKMEVSSTLLFLLVVNIVKEVQNLPMNQKRQTRAQSRDLAHSIKSVPHLQSLYKHRQMIDYVDWNHESSSTVLEHFQKFAELYPLVNFSSEIFSKIVPSIAIRSPVAFKAFWSGFCTILPESKQITTKAAEFITSCLNLINSSSVDSTLKIIKLDLSNECKNIISDLISVGLFSTSLPAFRTVKRILSKLNSAKTKNILISEILYECCNSSIFLYSSCANSLIRSRAVSLLESVFPVINNKPDLVSEQLLKNFELISSSLKDDSPIVRIAGIDSVVTVLSLFSSLVELPIKNDWIQSISTLISDKSCVSVRISALKAFSTLLGDPQLSILSLPAFSCIEKALFDPNFGVRKTAVKVYEKHLNLRLSEANSTNYLINSKPLIVRSIRWSIIQSLDNQSNCRIACKLLASIICSKNQSKKKIFKRIFDFVMIDKESSPSFLYYLPEFVAASNPKLISLLISQCFSVLMSEQVNTDECFGALLILICLCSNLITREKFEKELVSLVSENLRGLVEIFMNNIRAVDSFVPAPLPSPHSLQFVEILKQRAVINDVFLQFISICFNILANQSRDNDHFSGIYDLLNCIEITPIRIFLLANIHGHDNFFVSSAINEIMEIYSQNNSQIFDQILDSLLFSCSFSELASHAEFSPILDSISKTSIKSLQLLINNLQERTAVNPIIPKKVAFLFRVYIYLIAHNSDLRLEMVNNWINFGETFLLEALEDWDLIGKSFLTSRSERLLVGTPSFHSDGIFFKDLVLHLPTLFVLFVTGSAEILKTGLVSIDSNYDLITSLINSCIALTHGVFTILPCSIDRFRVPVLSMLHTVLTFLDNFELFQNCHVLWSTCTIIFECFLNLIAPVTMSTVPSENCISLLSKCVSLNCRLLNKVINSSDSTPEFERFRKQCLLFFKSIVAALCRSFSFISLPLYMIPSDIEGLVRLHDDDNCSTESFTLLGNVVQSIMSSSKVVIRLFCRSILDCSIKSPALSQGSILLFCSLIKSFENHGINTRDYLQQLLNLFKSEFDEFDDSAAVKQEFVDLIEALLSL